MSLLICGINYQTAPLSLREKVVFTPDNLSDSLTDLVNHTQAKEAIIVSTCNRSEFYCTHAHPIAITDWLQKRQCLSPAAIGPYLYIHRDEEAIRHLLRVASGLDSMVLGEPEILGQVKQAFAHAKTAGTLGTQLQRLFEYVFFTTKQVRSQTAIGAQPVSLIFTALNLAKHIFADLTKLKVLLLGAGSTIQLVAQHFYSANVAQFWVANRTLAHAEKLARQIRGQALSLDKIADYLPYADIVVAATASPLPLLGKGMAESALKIRKRRPIFMVDLAVPRNIEPEISQLEDVYLYTLDDLYAIIQQNLHQRQQAAKEAEAMIEKQVVHYISQQKVLDAAPLIKAYRDNATHLRDTELTKALQLIKMGANPEEVLKRLAHNLTNKLLHTPSTQLRQAAYDDNQALLNWARSLLTAAED